jgi:hypothetical protein
LPDGRSGARIGEGGRGEPVSPARQEPPPLLAHSVELGLERVNRAPEVVRGGDGGRDERLAVLVEGGRSRAIWSCLGKVTSGCAALTSSPHLTRGHPQP